MIKKKGIIFLILLFNTIILAIIPLNSNQEREEYYINGVPLVDQGDTLWCGSGSVAMVLGYWSCKNISIEEVGNKMDPENDGAYAEEILAYIKNLGWTVTQFSSNNDSSLKESFKELKKYIREAKPVIVSRWSSLKKESGHWSVVIGYDNDKIYLADPKEGEEVWFKKKEFEKLWRMRDGLGIVIEPIDSDKDTVPDRIEKKFKTDPLKYDTDGDGLSDGEEIRELKSDPLKRDTDNDGWSDKIDSNPISALSPNLGIILLTLFILIITLEFKYIFKKK